MQAIRTRYITVTNTKPSRMQAKCAAKTITMAYDHSLDVAGNHKAVCEKLIAIMGWNTAHHGDMVGGEFDNDTYWVFDDKRLKVLTAMVNSMREATWTGSPWGHAEFKEAVETIGAAHGYYGDVFNAPTMPHEIEEFKAKEGNYAHR